MGLAKERFLHAGARGQLPNFGELGRGVVGVVVLDDDLGMPSGKKATDMLLDESDPLGVD
jgi:hypothetical protein